MSRYLAFEHLSRNGRDFMDRWEFNDMNSSKRDADRKRLKIFMIHKPGEDDNLVKWSKGFLCSLTSGVSLDWLDADIGDIFTADDAKRLKETMAEAKKIIVLATPESVQFPLITWETGLADQMKGINNVAVLPVVHQNRSWDKRDVLQLYNRIEKPENDWVILSPGYDFKGMTFQEWLDE